MATARKAVVSYGGKDYALTDKQQRFIEEYCKDWNAAAAARRAGYSLHTARQQGTDNLAKPYLAKAVEARMAELSMSAAEIQARMTSMARGSLAPFLTTDEEGRLGLDLGSAAAEEHLHLIREVSVAPDGTIRMRLHDPKDALKELGHMRGLYDEKRGTETRIGILVLPPMQPAGTPSRRQIQVLDMAPDEDGVYRASEVGGNGKGKALLKGVIGRRKR